MGIVITITILLILLASFVAVTTQNNNTVFRLFLSYGLVGAQVPTENNNVTTNNININTFHANGTINNMIFDSISTTDYSVISSNSTTDITTTYALQGKWTLNVSSGIVEDFNALYVVGKLPAIEFHTYSISNLTEISAIIPETFSSALLPLSSSSSPSLPLQINNETILSRDTSLGKNNTVAFVGIADIKMDDQIWKSIPISVGILSDGSIINIQLDRLKTDNPFKGTIISGLVTSIVDDNNIELRKYLPTSSEPPMFNISNISNRSSSENETSQLDTLTPIKQQSNNTTMAPGLESLPSQQQDSFAVDSAATLTTNETSPFTNAFLGYELNIPSSWQQTTALNNGICFTGGLDGVCLWVYSLPTGVKVQEFADAMNNQRSSFGAQIGESRLTTFARVFRTY